MIFWTSSSAGVSAKVNVRKRGEGEREGERRRGGGRMGEGEGEPREGGRSSTEKKRVEGGERRDTQMERLMCCLLEKALKVIRIAIDSSCTETMHSPRLINPSLLSSTCKLK